MNKTQVSVPFCRIVGVATPTSDSHIGFEVWLPPPRLGMASISRRTRAVQLALSPPGAMEVALTAGYATLATDNGHVTDPNAPNGTNEQGWALGHPQKMVDFAWRPVHVSSVAAKNIVARFYGKKPSLSYFVGCSSGGRQAFMEATRFPGDFDGIVAGAPAWHWTN